MLTYLSELHTSLVMTVDFDTQHGYVYIPCISHSQIFTRAVQTAEHLTLASLGKSLVEAPPEEGETGDRMKSLFTEDKSIPIPFRAKLSDYLKSGYDRGHM